VKECGDAFTAPQPADWHDYKTYLSSFARQLAGIRAVREIEFDDAKSNYVHCRWDDGTLTYETAHKSSERAPMSSSSTSAQSSAASLPVWQHARERMTKARVVDLWNNFVCKVVPVASRDSWLKLFEEVGGRDCVKGLARNESRIAAEDAE